MEQNKKKDRQVKKKGLAGNTLVIIIMIMTCWLILYFYIGLHGGLG